MRKKTQKIQVRVSDSFVSRLSIAADVLEKDRSDLVREGTDEKIAALAQLNPKLQAALQEHEEARPAAA